MTAFQKFQGNAGDSGPCMCAPKPTFQELLWTSSAFSGIQISASSCSYNCPCPLKLFFLSHTSSLWIEASPQEHGRRTGFQRRGWCGAQLCAASHPCYARSLHPEEWDYLPACGSLLCSIHQLTTALQTGWTISWVSGLLSHKLWNHFPQKQLPLPWNFQHSKHTIILLY